MAPGAGTIAELARRSRAKQAFDAEMAALIALLKIGLALGVLRIIVHAVVLQWSFAIYVYPNRRC